MKPETPTVIILSMLIGTMLLALCLVAGCHDSSPVAPAPDSCCRVADSLTARVNLLEYELCVLTLVDNERRHQLACLRDWFVDHEQPWPSDCNGRPIDLTQCLPAADSVPDTGAGNPPDSSPENAPDYQQ
jgi:hypothetical protein